jgi:hypothetical protein
MKGKVIGKNIKRRTNGFPKSTCRMANRDPTGRTIEQRRLRATLPELQNPIEEFGACETAQLSSSVTALWYCFYLWRSSSIIEAIRY